MGARVRGLLASVRRTVWMVGVLLRAGMIPLVRPDRYVRMVAVVRRGVTATTGIALAAARAPRRTAFVDERGALTWAELDAGCDAFAVGLLSLTGGEPRTVAVLARNHRGFVHGLAGATRAGSDVLLLNTAFSGPQLRDVLVREQAAMVVYDQEFQGVVDLATDGLEVAEVVAWVDDATALAGRTTVDTLVDQHTGERPGRPSRKGSVILLTSGTTGTPKGAKRGADGGAGALAAIFDRIPWRAEETVVVAAPMFHAWGFGQLAVAAATTCTVVTRRRFDPEAARRGARPLPLPLPALRDRERLADAPGRRAGLHGPLRRRHLQQLQRHRGRAHLHRDPGRPAGRARHRRPPRAGHHRAAARRRPPRGAHRRGRAHLRAVGLAVLRLHLGGDQGLPRRLHGLRRRGPLRRRRPALRGPTPRYTRAP